MPSPSPLAVCSVSGMQPDFEAPEDADGNNVYQITVVADDGKGGTDDHAVTVTVENVNELGMVNLSSVQPQVGTELTATLTDPDGGMSGTTWKWETAENQEFSGNSVAEIDRSHVVHLHASG